MTHLPYSREALIEQVGAAFADDEHRPDAPLLLPKHRYDAFYNKAIEVPFAAHPGPLTHAFVNANFLLSTRLRPDAQRWFWRSALLGALRQDWSRHYDFGTPDDSQVSSLLGNGVRALVPNPCAVMHERTHYEDALAFREQLSETQRVVVSRFLGSVLQHPTFADEPLQEDAYLAVRGCWHDDEDSAQAASTYRANLHNFVRPPAEDPAIEAVIQRIEEAFRDTPYPTGPLMESGFEEGCQHALAFRGADWKTLTAKFCDSNYAAWSFMSPQAFRYFIPAAMCHHLGDGFVVDPVFQLVSTITRPSEWRAASRARMALFTTQERQAIVGFLRGGAHVFEHNQSATDAAIALWDPGDNP